MKIQGYRDTYYLYSGKVSDVCRPLALAGFAILWLFKQEANGQIAIPHDLRLPGFLIVLGLLADILQYAVGAIIWFFFYRCKEKEGVKEEDEIPLHSGLLEVPIQFFFIAKAGLFIVAYYFLGEFFLRTVAFK
jgi:hypothetical protein